MQQYSDLRFAQVGIAVQRSAGTPKQTIPESKLDASARRIEGEGVQLTVVEGSRKRGLDLCGLGAYATR